MSSTSPGREPLQLIEIEQEKCALTYGNSPCTAAIGTTGTTECFNTYGTCQDLDNYDGTETIKWVFQEANANRVLDSYSNSGGVERTMGIPCLRSVNTSPTKINVGGGDKKVSPFGIRAKLQASVKDFPWDDSVGDPYLANRTYDPYTQGSFWGKWLARNPYYNTYTIKAYEGYVGEAIGSMRSRTYILETITGPDSNGNVTIVAKDPLRLADKERSLFPPPANVTLETAGGITDSQTSNIEFLGSYNEINKLYGRITSGANVLKMYARIEDEIISYTGLDPLVTIDPSLGLSSLWQLEDGAGVNAGDSVGSTDALLVGSTKPTWTASGRYVTGLDFTAASTDAGLDTDATYSMTTNYSFGAWVYVAATATNSVMFSHHDTAGVADISLYYWSADSKPRFAVGNSTKFTFASAINLDEWNHYAVTVELVSGTTYLIRVYFNGVQENTTTVNLGSTTGDKIQFGNLATSNLAPVKNKPIYGIIDDCFYANSKLTAAQINDIKDAQFTDSIAAYLLQGVTRGELGTTAAAHDEDEKVSFVGRFECQPHLAVQTLLEDYAGLPSAYIPITDWQTEYDDHITSTFDLTGTVADSMSVNEIVGEIAQQTLSNYWWDEIDEEVKLLAIRPITDTPALFTDRDNIISDSTSLKVDQTQRVSRVLIYFNQRDPTEKDDELKNWANVTARVDTLAEDQYGEARTKVIFARWLTSNAQAFQLAVRLLSRYRDNPRFMRLAVDAKDRTTWTGDIVRVDSRLDQDATGATVVNYWQVISAVESEAGHMVEYELQRYEFGGVGDYAHYMGASANDWDNATTAEQDQGAWYTDASGLVPTDNSAGYPMQ